MANGRRQVASKRAVWTNELNFVSAQMLRKSCQRSRLCCILCYAIVQAGPGAQLAVLCIIMHILPAQNPSSKFYEYFVTRRRECPAGSQIGNAPKGSCSAVIYGLQRIYPFKCSEAGVFRAGIDQNVNNISFSLAFTPLSVAVSLHLNG
jgi:hypothetical protein